MMKIIRKYPLYLFLLPTFFVLHGFVENYGFVDIKEAGLLLISYLFLTMSIALFSYFFFRSWNRAALITVFWMLFFFFFAAIHEFMKANSPVKLFTRYSFLLSTALIILFVLFIIFRKSKKPFQRFSIYLNALFLIYIGVDVGIAIWKATGNAQKGLSVYSFAKENEYKVCDTCEKPDIYFVLYDEYTNSISMKEQYNFDNDLDSFLLNKRFSVQKHSRSNYNFTPFSMSSALNMTYLEGLANPKAVTADDYANCTLLIRDNKVIKFLDAHGYEIVNFSVFDLAGNPSRVDQSFLPLKTKLIADRTLFAHMNKDIGWLLATKWPFNLVTRNHFFKHKENNNNFQDLTIQAARAQQKKPRFFYVHFYMPHPPYFYDRFGKERDNTVVYNEFKPNPPASYLEYVRYVNLKIKELVETIQTSNPRSTIMLLSDHGFRENHLTNEKHIFRNLNAIYYPDHQYSSLYDSMTSVNLFRSAFNKMFNQRFPILTDSVIQLKDR
ncbi:MAG: sulfatase-like hydrolase/transferase [Chitinophagaceae bacterium]|nr:sulfatase-like hydrolase/transferase [Chitinophagaceae bacterium]